MHASLTPTPNAHTPTWTRRSVRKERKIRPGFTPQEDVRRFRGTRQQQMDSTALPKGHIIGWTPPPTSQPPTVLPASTAGMSKAQKKNEKRKEKRKEKRDEPTKVKDSWEDEDEDGKEQEAKSAAEAKESGAPRTKTDPADGLAQALKKLEVQ